MADASITQRRLSRWPSWLGAPLLPDLPGDPVDQFVAEVGKIAAEKRRSTDDELEMLAGILDRLAAEDGSGTRRRKLEKEILLWPKNFRALDDIIELVTGARNPLAAEMMDRMDAAAARFDGTLGEELKNELVKAAQGYPEDVNNCLAFLYASGVRRLSSGSLRLMRRNRGRYRPSATAHFERLTGAGDGWYFFLVSVGSYHTFVIAVRVSGEYRKYVKIEDGGAIRKYDAELNAYFDDYGAVYGASTRFWPVYAAPAPFTSVPDAGLGAEGDEPIILE